MSVVRPPTDPGFSKSLGTLILHHPTTASKLGDSPEILPMGTPYRAISRGGHTEDTTINTVMPQSRILQYRSSASTEILGDRDPHHCQHSKTRINKQCTFMFVGNGAYTSLVRIRRMQASASYSNKLFFNSIIVGRKTHCSDGCLLYLYCLFSTMKFLYRLPSSVCVAYCLSFSLLRLFLIHYQNDTDIYYLIICV